MNKGSYTYYDLIGHLVPGTVLLGFVVVVAKWLGWNTSSCSLSWAETLGFGSVLAYIAGILVQGISSWFEPKLHQAWGGKPSVKAIEKALEDKAGTSANGRYVAALAGYFKIESPEKNPQTLFALAKDLVNRKALGRSELFNSMYALFRAMLTVAVLVSLSSPILLVADAWDWWFTANWLDLWAAAFIGGIVLAFVVYRLAKDKAYDYVNEVIAMAGSSVLELTDASQIK